MPRRVNNVDGIDVVAPDTSDARLRTGLLLGGAGALMLALGAGPLYPLLTMAAFPELSNRLNKAGLQKAKQAFAPELNRVLDDISERFTSDVLATLQAELHGLQRAAENKYRELLQGELRQAQQEKSHRQESVALVRTRRTQLQDQRQMLEECKARLASLDGMAKEEQHERVHGHTADCASR